MEPLKEYGLEASLAVAGLAGGLLHAISKKGLTMKQRFLSAICGALSASFLTAPVYHAALMLPISLPPASESNELYLSTAFIVGNCGWYISEWVYDWVEAWLKGLKIK